MPRAFMRIGTQFLFTLGLANLVGAQSNEDMLRQEAAKAPPGAILRSVITSGFLEASTDNLKAVASTGFDLASSPLELGLRLTAKTPIQKGAEGADFADLKGLGDGTELELALTGHWWRAPARPTRLVEWCDRNKSKLSNVTDCTSLSSRQIPDSLYGAFSKAAGWTEPVIFDIGGKIGRTKRSYLDATTLAAANLDRLGYSLGIDVGRFATRLGPFQTALIAAGYHYQVDYKEKSASQICTPLGIGGALRCRTVSLGAPTRISGSLLNAEIRGFINPRWGFDPQYTIRTDHKTWMIEMPLYFIPDAKGALIGGFAPAYSCEDKNWGIRVFVGKAFGL
jgi:hypothetical protein